jgi:hypothetical protein
VSTNLRSWVWAGGSFVAGIGLLWWAHEQWLNLSLISIETGEMPSGRMLLWMLTLVACGFLVGLAVSSTRTQPARGRPGILLALAFIPFAVLYYFLTQVALGWFPALPAGLGNFLYTESTLLAASMILGFLLSGLVRGVERDGEESVEGPEQMALDVGDLDQ